MTGWVHEGLQMFIRLAVEVQEEKPSLYSATKSNFS